MPFCKAPRNSPRITDAMKINSVVAILTARADKIERHLLRPRSRKAILNRCDITSYLILYILFSFRCFCLNIQYINGQQGQPGKADRDSDALQKSKVRRQLGIRGRQAKAQPRYNEHGQHRDPAET